VIFYITICNTYAFSDCPVQLSASKLGFGFARRSQLRLFTFSHNTWKEWPIQIDPRDPGGNLLFPKDDFMNHALQASDRMSFETRELKGEKVFVSTNKKNAPCGANAGQEFQTGSEFGWIFNCTESATEDISHDAPVQFMQDKALITSQGYRYYFDPSNHILFQRVEIKQNDKWVIAAEDSSLNIRSDIKNFFTLNFDPTDISSRLEEYRMGPLGMVGRVSFYLNILFFKIKLALTTDVSFYKDSAHVPMIMFSPVEASKYLNPKSGIYYSWKDYLPMQRWNIPDRILETTEVKELLNQKCQESFCTHKMIVPDLLTMEFQISRSLAEKGFIPVWAKAEDVAKKTIPAIHIRPKAEGLYFETSRLEKGGHRWDFWLGLGASKAAKCPSNIGFLSRYN